MASTDITYPDRISPNQKSQVTVDISTNADGITGAGIADLGGMTLSGVQISTSSSSANYSFRGGHTSGTLQTIGSSSGDVLTVGSTVAGVSPGKTILFSPDRFAGVRFLQVMSGTTAAPIAGASTGLTMNLLLTHYGAIK